MFKEIIHSSSHKYINSNLSYDNIQQNWNSLNESLSYSNNSLFSFCNYENSSEMASTKKNWKNFYLTNINSNTKPFQFNIKFLNRKRKLSRNDHFQKKKMKRCEHKYQNKSILSYFKPLSRINSISSSSSSTNTNSFHSDTKADPILPYLNESTLNSVNYDDLYLNDYEVCIWNSLIQYSQQYKYIDYMALKQYDITNKMREILIDWLIELHYKLNLKEETLFLTVKIIDLYLICKPICKNVFQLLGITALLIACKMYEMFSPSIKTLVYFTNEACIEEQVIRMEREIIFELNIDFTEPSQYDLYEIIRKRISLTDYECDKIKCLFELSLINYEFIKYSSLEIGLAVILLVSNKNLDKYLKGVNIERIIKCKEELIELFHTAMKNKNEFMGVKKKFVYLFQ